MLLDLQLDVPPERAAERARELVAAGAGIVHVRGAARRVPPLAAASVAGVETDLMTNVAFYGSTPAYRPVLDVEGWGELQPELKALAKAGTSRRWSASSTTPWSTPSRSAVPRRSARPSSTGGSATWGDRVCCYFPEYAVALDDVRDLTVALGRYGSPGV